jgi:hypothetical protein
MGDQSVERPLPTHRTTQTQNKRTQMSMSRVGFEPTIPVFERAETVHASERAATVIGTEIISEAFLVWALLTFLVTFESMLAWLLGCRCRQTCRNCEYSQIE